MEKLLEKYHRVHDTECFINGLVAAQALCARRMIEATKGGEVELLGKVMGDIVDLMEKAISLTKD